MFNVAVSLLMASASESSLLPEELANQSVRLKEEQLRREEEKVCFDYNLEDKYLNFAAARD